MTTYLITGGAGSLGSEIAKKMIEGHDDSGGSHLSIRILDNNEYALSKMKSKYIRKLYGDVADKERVRKSMIGVDVVIHCAALKNLEVTEYNTSELIKTNVIGTDVVISTAVEMKVPKVLYISSDKAVEPSSVYGASKLIGEHIALNYNNMQRDTIVSTFRSGNFFSSNGNVFEVWKEQVDKGEPLSITDMKCTRYFIETDRAATIILNIIQAMEGGEIFIPDLTIIKEYSMSSLITRFLSEHNLENTKFINIIGMRKGEKLNEFLMTKEELIRKHHCPALNCMVIK